MHRHPAALVLALFAFAAGSPAAVAAAGPGDGLGATLLVPYFEVDLADAGGPTTLLSIANASADPHVAHVVLWSDWGVPTFSFDLLLDGHQLRSLNLWILFTSGSLPDGGRLPEVAGCADPLEQPALDLPRLRARHTGQPDPEDGLCYGSGRRGDDVATGFVTVDVTATCAGDEPLFPNAEGYFGPEGHAASDNVLWGEVFHLALDDAFAQGTRAVSIPAGPEHDSRTFYRELSIDWSSGGLDGRAPLPSAWRTHFFDGGGFDGGARVLAWLGGVHPSQPTACDEARDLWTSTCAYTTVTTRTEGGETMLEYLLELRPVTAVYEVGGAELPTGGPFGQLDVSHRVLEGCVIIPIGDFPLQAWVQEVLTADTRYSVGLEGVALD